MKGLAEAIILQSLEDLCTQPHRKESRKFFGKNGFRTCAEIAGIDTVEQFKILHLLGGRKNGRNSRVH
ncbi:MAG: hypothetical protein C4560_00945 [Nitrospiraceae bacterium]|nr:MAG: hypothetical protein C4560_00945 [Nitrospiraceae bacterium]